MAAIRANNSKSDYANLKIQFQPDRLYMIVLPLAFTIII